VNKIAFTLDITAVHWLWQVLSVCCDRAYI